MIRDFLSDTWHVFSYSFRGRNIYWHALAIVITATLVLSGFDWWFYESTRIDALRWIILTAGLGGFAVPILTPIALIAYGTLRKDAYALKAGIAVAQAAIVAWLISSTYKVFTGRIQPEFLTHNSAVDISHDFHFGILQHGIFWGWPSSHACVAVAIAVTICLLYRQPVVRTVVILWTLLVAFGAAIGFHWLSDVLAGAIIGTVIGFVAAHRKSVFEF